MNILQSVTVLAVRAVVGVLLVVSGVAKFNAGLTATIAAFDAASWPAPHITAPTVALLQIFGGGALALGLFTRVLGLLFAVLMAATIALEGAAVVPIVVAIGGLLLAALGGGRLSLDRLFFKSGEFGEYSYWMDQMTQVSNARVNSYTKYRTWGRKPYHAGKD